MSTLKNEDWAGGLFACEGREEVVNALTHGLGFVLSVVGAIVLLISVLTDGDALQVLGSVVYGISLVGVYAMSTLSHSCSIPNWRHRFRMLDQGFIYLLIVGTYTPLALAYLRTPFWLSYLALMWTIAIAGFVSKVIHAHRVHGVSIWIYVALGWMPIISMPTLLGHASSSCLWLVLIGGLCYTLGTVFLFMDGRVRHFHAVWHLLVIAGSTCHFFAILNL